MKDVRVRRATGVCFSIDPDRIGNREILGCGPGVTRHAIDPLQWSMDAFICDRFQTKLEDPYTGRKVG
jgi:hypothetical protein